MKILVALLAGVPVFGGCELVWDFSSRAAANSDVRALLQAGGLKEPKPECHMVGTSRDVTCDLRATAEGVATVARTLALQPVDMVSLKPDSPEWWITRKPHQCSLADRFGRDSRIQLYAARGRPPELRLPDGGAFEYLLLYYNPDSSRACLELSYAYG